MSAAQLHPGLPAPSRERRRWQPLRLGLVDLFYYDVEEFWFRDGRLLLRGNNGTGKSKVLALTLPFLLDGDHRAQRVEPDGDAQKRMDWNLLLGGRYHDRLGYAWLELGMPGEDGEVRTLTIGCGLKAVAGQGIARKWFFVTPQRIGEDLHLVDANRLALSRERLREALGDRGRLFDAVEPYRRAVDEHLFRLGQERYDALVTLLIQLRQPQLSRRPNPEALSRALTEALPPLPQAVIADVAAAMRALEEDRSQLAELIEARAAIDSFSRRYRRYAQAATKRRETLVRRAQRDYEETARGLADATGAHERAQAEEERLTAEAGAKAEHHERLTVAERELQNSDEMRDARQLHKAAEHAERTRAAAERAASDLAEAEDILRDRRREVTEAEAALDETAARLRAETATSAELADAAGVAASHAALTGEVVASAGTRPAAGGRGPDLPEAEAEALVSRRARAVTHLRRLVDAALAAKQKRDDAQDRRDEAAREREAAAEALSAAEDAQRDAADALLIAMERFAAETVVLRLPDLAVVLTDLERWVTDLDGPNPAEAAARRAWHTAADSLAAEDARLTEAAEAEARERERLRAERAELASGRFPVPPAPHTRDLAARTCRTGAPLWQVTEFAADLGEGERAGLEAALEASGLLDAWVTPEGGLLAPDALDTAVTIAAPAGVSLAAVLHPADDGPVPAEVVARVLRGIGLGPASAETWVDVSGRFRIGVAEGSWRKDVAAFVGHAAREAARRRRLAELDALLAVVESRLRDLATQRTGIADRRDRLEEDLRALPGDGGLRDVAAAVSARMGEATRAEERLEARDQRLTEAQERLAAAVSERDTVAAELDLPPGLDALARIAEAISDYRVALARLWAAVREVRGGAAATARAVARRDQAAATRERRVGVAADAAREARAAKAAHAEYAALAGAGAAEAQARLAAVLDEIKRIRAEQKDLAGRLAATHDLVVETRTAEKLLNEQLDGLREARRAQADGLRRLAATGVVSAALPGIELPELDEPWAPDPTVRLARRMDAELAAVDDGGAAWERLQATIPNALTELQGLLSGQGSSAEGELREDVLVVTVRYRSLTSSPHQLVGVLDQEVAARAQLLNEREQEILENHLVSEVASQLSTLIHGAERRLGDLNAELARRPTSAGMVLRLVWEPDDDRGPAGLREARARLLRQAVQMWSPADREAVGAFLKREIDRVRAEEAGGTWFDHLARAFDYRRWHRFAIKRQQPDGSWRSATGPASGGERVLAVTLPLFAAASGHYSSARETAPRLVLLDEAFAGVDDAARRQCMELLAAFDLDVVMTSEREWGCYPEVPGLAIAHLVRRDGIEAVHVSRWEWDGRVRVRTIHPTATARQPRPDPPPTPDALGLF